jgi:hypothetical protein
MFEDILGEEETVVINKRSKGDTKPQHFGEIWASKQRQIDIIEEELDNLEEESDDFDEEYLQMGIIYLTP